VWLAQREWQVAQEMACDELTLQVTRAPAGDYAALLLQLADRHRAGAGWPN
jgi:beta-lactamase regulating signal transducer with metallopeptidase domain